MVWLCLGSVSKDFAMDELNEILLNYIIYNVSVDHSFKLKNKIYLILMNI